MFIISISNNLTNLTINIILTVVIVVLVAVVVTTAKRRCSEFFYRCCNLSAYSTKLPGHNNTCMLSNWV